LHRPPNSGADREPHLDHLEVLGVPLVVLELDFSWSRGRGRGSRGGLRRVGVINLLLWVTLEHSLNLSSVHTVLHRPPNSGADREPHLDHLEVLGVPLVVLKLNFGRRTRSS